MNPWTDTFEQYRQTVLGENKKKSDKQSKERWQDDDADGDWYEKSDVDGKISNREKKAKKHNCASKVKHEEFGIGNPVKGMHDLDENGVVQHYDVFFEHGIEKNIPVSSLEILVTEMHEHVIHEGKKNCGCGQDPCITYGKGKNAHKMPDGTIMPGKTHKEEKVQEKCEYDNTKSHDYKKKKKKAVKEHHGIDIEHLDGTQTQIVDVVKAPKMVAAPKLSNWREDFVWDEALKNPKLELEGDGKKDVKNKVEINPTVATEGYMSKDKEGHTTGGFRISNKEAKKAKERLKKKYKKEEVEQIDEMDNVGGKAAAALATGGLAAGGFLFNAAKNAAERLKKKREDSMQKLNMGEEVEKKKLNERERYKFLKGGNPKNLAAPKGQNIKHGVTGVDYTLVQGGSSKKNISASHEAEGEVVTELNRYEKETGKSSGSMNMPKGKPTSKGGTSSPVMRAVRTKIRKETGKPLGQQKKTKGVKGNRQVGDRTTTPADSIAKRRQSKKDADAAMRDTRGT